MQLDKYLENQAIPHKVFACAIGVHPVLISQWARGKRRVPAEHCPSIDRETGGAVSCEELRPDVDWAYLRGSTARPIPDSLV